MAAKIFLLCTLIFFIAKVISSIYTLAPQFLAFKSFYKFELFFKFLFYFSTALLETRREVRFILIFRSLKFMFFFSVNKEYVEINGTSYYVETVPVFKDEADAKCSSLNMNVISFENAEKWKTIRLWLLTYGKLSASSFNFY